MRTPLLAMALLLCLAWPAPAQPDWEPSTDTSFDMRPLFYPVKNQLFRGSCGTFAVVAAMEFTPGIPRLSEAYIYARLKADAITVDGATLQGLKEFLDTHGLVAAEKLPYELVGVFSFDDSKPSEAAIGRAFNEKRGRQAAILEDEAIYRARGVFIYEKFELDWNFFESKLRSAKPIVCAFRLNGEHWNLCRTGMIHSDTITYKDGKQRKFADDGGHAVICVGYRTVYAAGDAAQQRPLHQLLIRNSWGPEWGMQGYAWVTWETYAKDRIFQAMTIDGMDTIVSRVDQTPVLDLRVQGLKWKQDNYSACLSTVVKSNWLPEGAIQSVEYTLYSGAGKMNPEFEKFPLATKTSVDAARGFLAVFDGLSDSSLNVKAHINYRLGGQNNFWFPVPEICQWSPAPDVTIRSAAPARPASGVSAAPGAGPASDQIEMPVFTMPRAAEPKPTPP